MIRIRFEGGSEQHVVIGYSPLFETALSLHVLVAPKDHALAHPWVRRMRTLDPELKRRVLAFGFVLGRNLPDVLLPAETASADGFQSGLARLTDQPPELLLEEFGRPLYDHGGRHGDGVYDDPAVRETMLHRASGYGEASRRLAELLLADPTAFAHEFARLLEDYWQASFGGEWPSVEPRLRASVVESKALLVTSGLWSVLGRLPPRCRVDPEQRELQIDLPHAHTIDVTARRPVRLVPSLFVWPELRVSCDGPWPVTLVYAAPQQTRDAQPRRPPGELLAALRALADDTRLRVLKLISERPRSTQELAPLVGLSSAGLSKTLGRLSDAGLITSRREGYYVVYSLAPDRIDEVSAAVHEFLES